MADENQSKPLKEVPGSYGLPLLGVAEDNLDFYTRQGEVEFFKSRVAKHQSTVFKVNFAPGPPGFPDSRGVALLDQCSFPVLFDNSKIEKRDCFTGSFKASSAFNGGYRVLSYLDNLEPRHALLKKFAFEMLRRSGSKFLPEFELAFKAAFDQAESEIEKESQSEIVPKIRQLAFNFLVKSIVHVDPLSTDLGSDGPDHLLKWISVQFAPVSPPGSTPLPGLIEEALLHKVPLPFLLVEQDYKKLYDYFLNAGEMIEMATKEFGLELEEAVHNLVFLVGMNSWLGFTKVLPTLLFRVAELGAEFQLKLGDEIRSAMASAAGGSTSKSYTAAVENMPLLKSTLLEILRYDPPVLYQYGRAREDLIVESHDSKFAIEKGQFLGGSQALVCRDAGVFKEPEKLIPERFMGPEKSKLEENVFWSNGRNTDSPTVDNKQCAGKNLVETISKFFIVLLFMRFVRLELTEKSTIANPILKCVARA